MEKPLEALTIKSARSRRLSCKKEDIILGPRMFTSKSRSLTRLTRKDLRQKTVLHDLKVLIKTPNDNIGV